MEINKYEFSTKSQSISLREVVAQIKEFFFEKIKEASTETNPYPYKLYFAEPLPGSDYCMSWGGTMHPLSIEELFKSNWESYMVDALCDYATICITEMIFYYGAKAEYEDDDEDI